MTKEGKVDVELRAGNIALDIPRPLYDQGEKWAYMDLKNNLLEKGVKESVTALPKLQFMELT